MSLLPINNTTGPPERNTDLDDYLSSTTSASNYSLGGKENRLKAIIMWISLVHFNIISIPNA